jgi:TRAP transporter 4TM/12TM fusion protein
MKRRAIDSVRRYGVRLCGLLLPLFVLVEVNYPRLGPQAQLAVFFTLGLMLVFLAPKQGRELSDSRTGPAILLVLLALATLAVGCFVVVQTEPAFASRWLGGVALGERAGLETSLDIRVGIAGLVLVLVGAHRSVGIALPLLSTAFLVYGYWGAALPDWLLPHRGYSLERLVSQTFLHSQGVFGVALNVMFTYVCLFVVFGALLEATGASEFIIGASRRLFRGRPGGPAKVAVISSGLMGSLSGSAVANTASTGTFTIPMMKSAGFAPRVAAGLEAAASSGGALVPPVMGAGAYMMLEIIDPPVTYLEVIRAALIPAILYYVSLYMIVHFYGGKMGVSSERTGGVDLPFVRWEGAVFLGGLGILLALLLAGYTVFRAVTVATIGVVLLGLAHPRTRLGPADLLGALRRSAERSTPLVAAAACVGVVIGVVTLTGVGTRLPAIVLPLAQESLLLALVMIMLSSLVLGMGLPSAVCYLLMATLIGPVLGKLGVVPLAAHLFIFYFGMMSMVTPPVALAGYAASSIADSKLIETSISAFRFSLVGFVLPFVFVFQPQLLMLAPDGGPARLANVVTATLLVTAGVYGLAAAVVGYMRRRLRPAERLLFTLAALLLFYPGGEELLFTVTKLQMAGLALLGIGVAGQWRASVHLVD